MKHLRCSVCGRFGETVTREYPGGGGNPITGLLGFTHGPAHHTTLKECVRSLGAAIRRMERCRQRNGRTTS